MNLEGSVIETGVDRLVNLVKERGRILLTDAAKELGVSPAVIQEWVDFLEEEGILSVDYKLTKPYLVERKLTKKEVEDKAKEFSSKKDVFVRKAEVSLSFLEKQEEELRKVKSEFDRLKSELGFELDNVRNELSELEKYHQSRQELQKQIQEQKDDAKAKIEELTKQILREQQRYQEMIADISKEKEELSREKVEAKSIEESEAILNKKLAELKGMIILIENKISKEDISIKNSESHIDRLSKMIEGVKSRVEEEKSAIEPLIGKSHEQEKKIIDLQSQIIRKITENQKNVSKIDDIKKQVSNFFEKKMVVANLVDKVNKDRDELEKSLIELIKKAKSFQLTAKSSDVGKEMIDLEKKFNDVNKKKSLFEEELKRLTSFFRV